MGIWNRICGFFGIGADDHLSSPGGGCDINPATGLPMIDGIGGVDVGGSPFGSDIHETSHFDSGIIDSFSSGMDFGSSDFNSSFDNSGWNSWGD